MEAAVPVDESVSVPELWKLPPTGIRSGIRIPDPGSRIGIKLYEYRVIIPNWLFVIKNVFTNIHLELFHLKKLFISVKK